jgi:hypothetical protein
MPIVQINRLNPHKSACKRMLDRNPCPTNLGMLIILRERQYLPCPKTLWALLLSGELPSGQDSLGCALTPWLSGLAVGREPLRDQNQLRDADNPDSRAESRQVRLQPEVGWLLHSVFVFDNVPTSDTIIIYQHHKKHSYSAGNRLLLLEYSFIARKCLIFKRLPTRLPQPDEWKAHLPPKTPGFQSFP